MKALSVLIASLILAATQTLADYADSVWLDYKEGLATSGDVIITDMKVEETALYTYYAGLVWNNGYMGLQRAGSGYYKHVHFSVWDPSGGGVAELVSAEPGVVTERFGGEGTGWKAMWPFNWQQGTTYRLGVTLTHTNAATDYTAYFFDPTAGTWKRIATFRRNDAEHSFSYVSSFVEDFGDTLASRRSCLFGNAWLRTFQSDWVDLRTASYATGSSQTNKDADVVSAMFRLETGGNTVSDTPAYAVLVRPAAATLPTNHNLKISLLGPGQAATLQWQTLPWPSYSLEWTTNLIEWPLGQRQLAASNIWVETTPGTKVKFFRTISSE